MIDFEVVPTLEDYRQGQYLHFFRGGGALRWGVLIVAYSLVFGWIAFEYSIHRLSYAWLFAFSIPFVLLGARMFAWPRKIRDLWEEQEDLHAESYVCFDSQGMFCKTEFGEQTTLWDHVYGWAENRDAFLIYRMRYLFHIVPKRALNEAQIDAIHELLTLKAKRV